MTRRLALIAAALAAIVSVVPTPGQAQSSGSAGVDVKAAEFSFSPAKVDVDLGATVRWTNAGEIPHVVTDRGGAFDTQPILPARSRTVTFTVPGTYSYFCRVHPGRMNATIVVRGAGEQARVNRVEAKDLSFTPPRLTVATGSLLLLANVGGLPHTLTAPGDAFDTGVVTPGPAGGRFAGNNASITLTTPGRYAFFCRVHPKQMRGVITVTGPLKDGAIMGVAAPRTARVKALDFTFRSDETTIAPGGEVTWTNAGVAPHTASFDDVMLGTDVIESGASATLRAPTQPGTYSYRCSIHPTKMRAVLVVLGANMSDPRRAQGGNAVTASLVGGQGIALSSLALITGVAGAFLGGFGINGFLLRRTKKRAAASRRG